MSRPLPPVIRIEPASACNLRCGHCPTGTVEMARGLMSEKVFSRVLSEVAKHVPPIRVAVLYHGGEPLLNKRFPGMARAVKSLGIPKVKTVTNGMFLRGEVVPALIDSGLDEVEISLDGDSGAQSDAVRRRSSFERICANVRALAAAVREQGSPLRIYVSTTQFKDAAQHADAQKPAWLREAFADFPEVAFKSTWAMVWPNWRPKVGFDVLPPPDNYTPPCSCPTFSARFAEGEFPPPCDTCGLVVGDRFLVPC